MTLKKRTRWLLASLLFPAMFLGILFHTLWRKTEVVSLTDAGPTLVIDPGHGGIDCGALGADGTKESDLNLEIALKLRALAELYGKENLLIRQDDRTRCDTESYSEHRDLECRVEDVEKAANPIYISIHQNTFPTGQASGPQVIYAPEENSRRLGTVTHANLLRSLYTESRRVAEPGTGKFYILSHLKCPAILVECGFLSNAADLANLKRPEFQVSLAAVLMASYLQYLVNTERI